MVTDGSVHESEELARRHRESLARALGAEVMAALGDGDVTEVYTNPPRGVLYLDTRSRGRIDTGVRLAAERVQRFLNIVASGLSLVLDAAHPKLQAELPPELFAGARVQGFVPPLAAGPCFNIRKPPGVIHSLDDYVACGTLSPRHRAALGEAVRTRRNILVAGGTASGKTTLANALLLEIATTAPQDRIVVLEDTVELRCAAPDHLALRTSDEVKLKDLVKAALRAAPDRIVVGEVRDEAALDLCDAWETGHPGGCATLHANDPLGALHRLDRLAQRNPGVGSQCHLVGSAIQLVVMLAGGSRRRRVTDLVTVEGWDGAFRLRSIPAI